MPALENVRVGDSRRATAVAPAPFEIRSRLDRSCERRTGCAASCARAARCRCTVSPAGRSAHDFTPWCRLRTAPALLGGTTSAHCVAGTNGPARQTACGSSELPSPAPSSRAPSHSRSFQRLQLGMRISIHHWSGDCSLWRSPGLQQPGGSRSQLEHSGPPRRQTTHINEPIQQSHPLANGTYASDHPLQIVRSPADHDRRGDPQCRIPNESESLRRRE